VSELANLDVLIVDCQTTGASPALGAVLELGWCVVRANRPELVDLQAHWVALPEGTLVPAQVRRLTGFDERLATAAVAPEAAWNRLKSAFTGTGCMPAAIHFARFELPFLRDWASRFEPEAPFPLDAVCVHAIACRLYPDLPRRSLRALAGYLGHGLHLTRRCLGHVEATAFIWQKLTRVLAERGVQSWGDLHTMLREPGAASSRSRKRSYPIPSTLLRALPDAPGVYHLLRSNGEVVYVGKASNLRKRVASHFKSGPTSERVLEMLTQVSDIRIDLTETALEAALLENERIKTLHPPYNQQLTGPDRPVWFTTRHFDSAATAPSATKPVGPVPCERSLVSLPALIQLLSDESPAPALRAAALGTSEAWAPDPGVFAAGFSQFFQKHLAASAAAGSLVTPRRRALDCAKGLLLSKLAGKPEEEPDLTEPELLPIEFWDPERIVRHLERTLAQAYQLLRRARWLYILHDSDVMYREPESARTRVLLVGGGNLLQASDLEATSRLPTFRVPLALQTHSEGSTSAATAAFDRSKYDRLRVLTTELKRIRRDGGDVIVLAARGRRLTGAVLDSIFRLV
jgi:DNA polymerase-3 subunit epsilon